MRDADGARAATVALLEIAARDLDAKLTGARISAPGPARSRKVRGDRMAPAVRGAGLPG